MQVSQSPHLWYLKQQHYFWKWQYHYSDSWQMSESVWFQFKEYHSYAIPITTAHVSAFIFQSSLWSMIKVTVTVYAIEAIQWVIHKKSRICYTKSMILARFQTESPSSFLSAYYKNMIGNQKKMGGPVSFFHVTTVYKHSQYH